MEVLEEPVAHANASTARRGDYLDIWTHHTGGVLVYACADYIVRLDERGRIDWETTTSYDDNLTQHDKFDSKQKTTVLDELAYLETLPCGALGIERSEHYRRLLGEAIRSMLAFEYASAKRTLAIAKQYYLARTEEVARDWYLMGAFVTASPFVIAAPILWAYREPLRSLFGQGAFWLLICLCAGAIGALFSVIARAGKVTLSDASSGKRMYKLEGCTRVIAGGISGLVVALAIRSDIIFANLTGGGKMPYVLVLGAVIGGCGERLVTSIISRLDGPAAKPMGAKS